MANSVCVTDSLKFGPETINPEPSLAHKIIRIDTRTQFSHESHSALFLMAKYNVFCLSYVKILFKTYVIYLFIPTTERLAADMIFGYF